MSSTIATIESGEAISSFLKTSYDWTIPAEGESLKRDTVLERFDAIADAALKVHGTHGSDFSKAYEDSATFVNNAFDVFEKKIEVEKFDWTFAVPARGEETQGEQYASEVTFFLPLLDPKFGVNSLIRQRTVAHLAPTIIETYRGNDQGVQGALIWTPVYFDPKAWNIDAARHRINESAGFIRNTLGAKVMGLGAILPALTSAGRKISEEGLVTTTGHGGTVHLVAETVQQVAESLPEAPRIGVLGLGSIGSSSLEVLRENASASQAKNFIVFDSRPGLVTKAVNSHNETIPTFAAENTIDLIHRSDIIVTAITDTIDLDTQEQLLGAPIDLTGKIIIDDSQPGCFDRAQVEARGGHLVWVVGEDTTEQHAFKRLGGYSYGEAAGLYGERAVWGCEAEAGSIAMSGTYESAVNTSVTPEIARKVGEICFSAGVRVSRPFQSFGQPVHISVDN